MTIRVGAAACRPAVHLRGERPRDLADGDAAPDLPEPERARLEQVTENASVTAQSNGESFLVRDDVFEYLLDHPDFATHVIRALEIGRYRIWREPDGLWLDDTAGALVRFRIAYATRGSRIFYLQGRYQTTGFARDPRARRGAPRLHHQAASRRQEPHHAGDGQLRPDRQRRVRSAGPVVPRGRGAPSHEGDDAHRRRHREDARAIDDDPGRVDAALRERPDVPPRELRGIPSALGAPLKTRASQALRATTRNAETIVRAHSRASEPAPSVRDGALEVASGKFSSARARAELK